MTSQILTVKSYLINIKNIHFLICIECRYLKHKRLIWKHSKSSFSKESTAYSHYLWLGSLANSPWFKFHLPRIPIGNQFLKKISTMERDEELTLLMKRFSSSGNHLPLWITEAIVVWSQCLCSTWCSVVHQGKVSLA